MYVAFKKSLILKINNMDIIPSLLVTTEEAFKQQTSAIAGKLPFFQIDIADGQFVPNKTWASAHAEEAAGYVQTDFELHLMVQDPLAVIREWKDHPHLKRILLHVEPLDDVGRAIEYAKGYEKEIGLVLNPDTPLPTVYPYLDEIDSVMFMGVHPGFQGQAFIENTVDRIKELRRRSDVYIEVDGGVNKATLPKIFAAGANAGCPGSAVFGHPDGPAVGYAELIQLAHELSTR